MTIETEAQDDARRPDISDSDERREIRGLIQRLEVRSWVQALQALGCLVLAWTLTFLPAHPGLSHEGKRALFILLLAGGLWVTEAIAAYGVALLVVALEILLLGHLGRGGDDWARFLAPWASPLLWLFLGGFVLGKAAAKTGLDRWLDTGLARWLVERLPASDLGKLSLALAAAYATAMLSNFMSNTAAASILIPIGVALGQGFEVLVAVPIALAASSAMCLPISTPPNAIAFAGGELESREFLGIGLLLAMLAPAVAVGWCTLVLRWL